MVRNAAVHPPGYIMSRRYGNCWQLAVTVVMGTAWQAERERGADAKGVKKIGKQQKELTQAAGYTRCMFLNVLQDQRVVSLFTRCDLFLTQILRLFSRLWQVQIIQYILYRARLEFAPPGGGA